MLKTYLLGAVLLVMIAASVVAVGLLNPHIDLFSMDRHDQARVIPAAVKNAADQNGSAKPNAPQLKHMRLEGEFTGPLQDTVIQRWRDPVDGTVCYIYLPIVVAHTPGPSGFIQYGANGIGSISCFAPQPQAHP